MLEEAELKSLELRTSFAHTNILTSQELVTLRHALMICEQESIVTSLVYRLGLNKLIRLVLSHLKSLEGPVRALLGVEGL